MRLRALSLTAAFLAAAASPAPLPLHAQTLSPELERRIAEWYGEATRRSNGLWGIAIGTLDGRVLWSAQPEMALIPASTVKVFTTGFARSRVGGEARKTTRVVGVGRLDEDGTWRGPWSLQMTGDPTLERTAREGPMLQDLALDLARRGVRRLEGPLMITSALGPLEARYPAVWAERYLGKLYAPPISPVVLRENTVSITVRPGRRVGDAPEIAIALPRGIERLVKNSARTVAGRGERLSLLPLAQGGWQLMGTIGVGARPAGFSDVAHDPTDVLEAAWAAALERAGIAWDRARPAQPDAADGAPREVLAAVYSPTFDSVAAEVNSRSLNVGAEMLLLWGAGGQEQAAAELTRHVREVVGPSAVVHLADGSGLSELNRVSPRTQILYLARIAQRPGMESFPLLLPANGMGTLRHLRHGMGSGVAHAKTGTLDGAATLVGYLGRPDGVLVISLMYNGPRTGVARAAQWELFRLLGADGVSLPAALETQMGGPSATR